MIHELVRRDHLPEELEGASPDDLEEMYRELVQRDYLMLPEAMCPICRMDVFTNSDLARFLKKQHPDVLQSIRDSFQTYKQFKSYLKE